ncbi:hypothetical protein [Pedobacter sp. HMWF019]|uniref:hypothetical protein n=1 Tax=Pedobacter sp. HMWF019 TaxID=2056856 RepID=UPI0011B2547C|nr:hypothetical protein [Pedobacter sp. HMWF019]
MKKSFKFPFLALILGLGLVVSQSAFKPVFASTWGNDPIKGWVNLASLPSTGNPDTHYEPSCTGPTNVCTRNYSTGDPINGGSFTNGSTGNFSLVEVDN